MKILDGKVRDILLGGPGGASAAAVLLFAAALAAYAVLFCAPPAFDPRYSLYMDSTSFYWIQALWDGSLFPADPLAGFYVSKLHSPGPEALWSWTTALFMRTVPYTHGLKVLSVLACGAAVLMVRRQALASPARPAAGLVSVLFAALFLSMDTFFGVPRLYGALVFLGFGWALEARRFMLLPFLTALCFAVYPSASAGLGLTAALVPFFFRSEFSAEGSLRRYLAALAGGALLCLFIASGSELMRNAAPEADRLASFESSKFHQMVSSSLDPFDPADALLNFVLNLNEHGRLYSTFMALLALLFGLGLLVVPGRPRMFPRALVVMLAGCGAAFLLLYLIHPVSASRQLVFAVPLAMVFLGAEGGMRAFGGFRFLPSAAAAGLLFAVLHPVLGETVSMREYSGVYKFVGELPSDAVLGGYPESRLLQTLPVFSRRQAAGASENADQEILFLMSPSQASRRRADIFAALYCSDPSAPRRLAREHGIGWLVVEERYYTAAFLAAAASSPVPSDREALEAALAGPGAEACYGRYARSAVYSWPGGAVVPLATGGK